MTVWPEWVEAGLDGGWGEDEDGVPGCAGSSAPGVEIMYLWSPYLLAYTVVSLIAQMSHHYDEPRYGFYSTDQLNEQCSFSQIQCSIFTFCTEATL